MLKLPQILADIDAQIAKLQQARALLAASGDAAPQTRRGRPKGSTSLAPVPAPSKKAKRTLSPEGRKRIAEAMKKRWANRKGALKK